MCFVHKEAIYTQFLKGDYIILLAISLQLVQTSFQLTAGFFHLLDCISFT